MLISGKTYLVTGGTGFIGSGLVRGLLRSGAKVRSFDDDSRGARRRLADVAADVEFLTGDIRDAAAVARATKGVDAVCHLAYVNGTEFFYTKPDLVIDVAIRGMLHVLDACRQHGVRELFLASSSEVYQTPPHVPTDETAPLLVPDPVNPRYSYGGGKIACELMSLHYGRTFLDRVLVVRPHNVYGPDMGWEHVVPQLALRMAALFDAQKDGVVDVPIQGSGEETRAFVYIDDMIDGAVRILERGQHQNIYHVGTSREVSIADLARAVARCLGREIRLVPGTLQKGSTLRRCPDIAKMRAIGYEPRVTLEDGLATTVRWYREHAREQPSP